MRKWIVRFALIAGIAGLAVVGYFAWVIHDLSRALGPAAQAFDAATWKAEAGATHAPQQRSKWLRLGMVDDLLAKGHLKPGMNREAVIGLLGVPSGLGPGQWQAIGERLARANRFEYVLGPEAFGVDYEILVVEFDASGLTRAYRSRT